MGVRLKLLDKLLMPTVLSPPCTMFTYTADTYNSPRLPGLAHWTDIKVSALGFRVGWTHAHKERTNKPLLQKTPILTAVA